MLKDPFYSTSLPSLLVISSSLSHKQSFNLEKKDIQRLFENLPFFPQPTLYKRCSEMKVRDDCKILSENMISMMFGFLIYLYV